jgi:glycosyltransferase involved in cell wall biosynthesis
VRELGLTEVVRLAGHSAEADVAAALGRAACLATASEREGYGLVAVEAAARGTPSVVVAGPENAATELVHDGVNGAVAGDASAPELGDAVLTVLAAGSSLRDSTALWYAENAERLSLTGSLELVLRAYAEASRQPGRVASR